MTASNLAICFAPSLFHVYGAREGTPKPSANPPKTREAKGGAGAVNGGCQKLAPPVFGNELHEQLAAQECLTFMISNAKELFSVCEQQLNALIVFINHYQCYILTLYQAFVIFRLLNIVRVFIIIHGAVGLQFVPAFSCFSCTLLLLPCFQLDCSYFRFLVAF